jgi:hypothetical protein
MYQHPPSAWLMLNSYGVLVAGLEIVVGLSGLLTPERLVAQFGHVPPLSYAWLFGYVAGGVLLLAALYARRVEAEVYSIVLLIGANLLQLTRAFTLLGVSGVARDVFISALLIATMVMRIRALLVGGTFVVPRWHRRRRG